MGEKLRIDGKWWLRENGYCNLNDKVCESQGCQDCSIRQEINGDLFDDCKQCNGCVDDLKLSHPTPPQGVADARGMTEDDG